MSIFEPNNSGTVEFTNASTAIVGVGTTFTEYRAGSIINIPGLGSMQLASDPVSDTAAVGQVAWQGASTGAKPFVYEPRNEQATFSQKLTALLNELSNGNIQAEAAIDGTGGNWLSYYTGTGTKARTALTALARTLLDDTSQSAMRATIGAQAAGSYQAGSPTLSAIAAAATVFPSSLGLNLSGSMEFIALATSAQAKAGTNTLNPMTSFSTAEAIRQLVVRTQIFTASGTYTPHPNMLFADAEGVGGGGSGGGTAVVASTNMAAPGGGAGAYARRRLTKAQIGASQPVTIGLGGAPNSAGPNPGNAGGTTSLGTLLSAGGGNGGGGATNPNNISPPGGGGAATIGDLTLRGSDGGGGAGILQSAGQAFYSGYGGASILSGTSVTSSGASNGTAGKNFGGGGSGGTSAGGAAAAGGAGAQGILIITEFCWA